MSKQIAEMGYRDTWPAGVPFLTERALAELKRQDPTFQKGGAASEIFCRYASEFMRSGMYFKVGEGEDADYRPVPRSTVSIVRGGEIISDVPAYQVPGYADIGEAFVAPGDYGTFYGLRKPKEVILAAAQSDDRWQLFFRTVQSNEYNGERYDRADMAIVFEELALGEPPKFGKVSGTYVTLPNRQWGAGMKIHDVWIKENKVWQINDQMETARRKAQQTISKFFFAMLKNASFNSTAYADSWVKTMNAAYARLCRNYVGTNTDDKVYIPGNPLVIVCPVEKESEILTAIRLAQVTGYQGDVLAFPTSVVIGTTEYAPTDKQVDIVVPKKEFIHQEYKPLYVKSDYDIETESQRWFWRFWMNGLVKTAKAGERITYTDGGAL